MKLLVWLGERLMMRKLWEGLRSGIEHAAIAGSGGIVMLGDSITHMGRWDLIFPELPMRNLGISGERSEHLLLRLDPLVAIAPQKVFILIGTNDLATGRKQDDIARDVEALVVQLKGRLPGCAIHLQGLMPRAKSYAARVKALNAAYAAIAQRHGVVWIDLFPVFDDGTSEMRAELTNDKLHLTGPGYAVWRDVLRPYLAA